MLKRGSKKILAAALSTAVCAAMLAQTVSPAFAASELDPKYTYTNGDYTFEKISHPNSPVESADGIVDYIGNGSVEEYVDGQSSGEGDRGQSYSYASATYGDWVYINTMYGGLGVSSILSNGMLGGLDAETAKAMMNVMYNGNLYLGEPDSKYAGGVLLKFNVKTGETKILMSRDVNGIIPTFRSAIEMNGKLYFVGMVVDTKIMTAEEIARAIAVQNGLPCIYEIDPENNDKLTCIYNCVDMDGYHKLVNDNVFTSTRAIAQYKDSLIAGCLDTEGVFLCASDDPSKGQDSFKVIATMEDLFNYPAYHRSDVNGGGGIYQVIEFNNKLYVVICTGTAESKNPETGTLQTFAIIRGECNGNITDKDSWTWTVLAGDENDGAKYPFGLDEERVSCGACTLEVYGDYLYIGDYNDVSSALQGFALRKDFKTQATNLEQSINLYRMDKEENIEMVVGDPTTRFPNGGISGLGSGYNTHMSQYTWQTTVYEGKLYVSTMDTTTLLEPIAQFTNGDLVNMSKEEWESQINYIRVLVELLMGNNQAATYSLRSAAKSVMNEETAKNMVELAIKKANLRAGNSFATMFAFNNLDSTESIELTDEQIKELVNGLLDGSIAEGLIPQENIDELIELNNALNELKELINSNDIESFIEIYEQLLNYYNSIYGNLNENLKNLYDMILSYATLDNLEAFAKSIKYLATSEAGFDLYEITQNDDGTVDIEAVTTNGFGDRYNHGLRIFAKTTDYLLIGTANPFYGTQLWRRANTVTAPESSESSQESSTPESSQESSAPESSQESSAPESQESSMPESSQESKDESSKDNSDITVDNSSGNESGQNQTVNTGDSSNIAFIAVIMAASATAVILITKKSKSSKTK